MAGLPPQRLEALQPRPPGPRRVRGETLDARWPLRVVQGLSCDTITWWPLRVVQGLSCGTITWWPLRVVQGLSCDTITWWPLRVLQGLSCDTNTWWPLRVVQGLSFVISGPDIISTRFSICVLPVVLPSSSPVARLSRVPFTPPPAPYLHGSDLHLIIYSSFY